MSFKHNISFSESEEISDFSPSNLTPIININSDYQSPREAASNLYLLPSSILQEMQLSLPPDEVRKFLSDQADMLDNMVNRLQSPVVTKKKTPKPQNFCGNKEDVLDKLRGDVSRRVNELEKEQRDEVLNQTAKKWEGIERLQDDDLVCEELEAIKNREKATYVSLKKAYHQIHMLEFQLLESQRKHFTELEKMKLENSELRRMFETAQFKIVSGIQTGLVQENQFLKTQAREFSRQMDVFRENVEIGKGEEGQEMGFGSFARYGRDLFMDKGLDRRDQGHGYLTPKSNRNTKVEGKKVTEINEGANSEYRINQIRYSEEKRMRNRSNNMSQILSWSPETQSPRHGIQESLKEKLNLLLKNHEALKSQLSQLSSKKVPNPKSKKKDLEIELTICENNINQINSKLRKINSMSTS